MGLQFFEEERLRSYIAANQDSLMSAIDIPRLIRDTVEKPDFDATLLTAMTDLSAKPEGAMLQIVAQMVRHICDLHISCCWSLCGMWPLCSQAHSVPFVVRWVGSREWYRRSNQCWFHLR